MHARPLPCSSSPSAIQVAALTYAARLALVPGITTLDDAGMVP
jgi:hypothetical protein